MLFISDFFVPLVILKVKSVTKSNEILRIGKSLLKQALQLNDFKLNQVNSYKKRRGLGGVQGGQYRVGLLLVFSSISQMLCSKFVWVWGSRENGNESLKKLKCSSAKQPWKIISATSSKPFWVDKNK